MNVMRAGKLDRKRRFAINDGNFGRTVFQTDPITRGPVFPQFPDVGHDDHIDVEINRESAMVHEVRNSETEVRESGTPGRYQSVLPSAHEKDIGCRTEALDRVFKNAFLFRIDRR